jgi:hypothetical protein
MFLRASLDRHSSPEPRVNMTPMTLDSATTSKKANEAYPRFADECPKIHLSPHSPDDFDKKTS